MRLRLSDSSGGPDLNAFLTSRIDCVAVRARDNEIDVSLLGSYAHGARERELATRVRAWQAERDGIDVALVGARELLRPLG